MKRARWSFDDWWTAVGVVLTLANVAIWTYLLSQLVKALP